MIAPGLELPQLDADSTSLAFVTKLPATIESPTEIVPSLASSPPPVVPRSPPLLLAIVEAITVVVLEQAPLHQL